MQNQSKEHNMFNRKIEERVYQIEKQVEYNARRIGSIIKQLNCEHQRAEFSSWVYYHEWCPECRKDIQRFNSETDYRKAIIKGLEKQLETETAKLKQIKNEM